MRTTPITYNDGRPAKQIGISAEIAGRIGAGFCTRCGKCCPDRCPCLIILNFFSRVFPIKLLI
jgi:hypothetical protein